LYKINQLKKVIQIPGAPAPIGPYSQAILIKDTLYVSGQIPMNPATGEIERSSIEAATHLVMKNLLALVNEAGMDVDNIVKCSIFMKDLGQFTAMNEIYGTYFRSLPPARETVQVAGLPKDVDIEISCIAVK
jgi:2-iminobutanoate/2-iminopropanoate deaminase